MRPRLVVHCDWSTIARKRWMAVAEWTGRSYLVEAPVLVGDAATLVEGMRQRAEGGGLLIGFDFPIGLPAFFAQRAGLLSFTDALNQLGKGRWARFYEVASQPSEVALERPFFPMRSGTTERAHLVRALGAKTFGDLLRRCERKTEARNEASALFWTLGGKQVGKAAIAGWQSVIAPAVHQGAALWPFDGSLHALILERECVIAETYPAQACVQLGLQPPGRGWSKRKRTDRQAQAFAIRNWAQDRSVELSLGLRAALDDGFGERSVGEDGFDATVGLLGMLDVATSVTPDGCPDNAEVRHVEGWILGQVDGTH